MNINNNKMSTPNQNTNQNPEQNQNQNQTNQENIINGNITLVSKKDDNAVYEPNNPSIGRKQQFSIKSN